MSAQHTPGPWVLEGHWSIDDKPMGGWISTKTPMPLFELGPVLGAPEEMQANARLIAAAPDLLQALKWFIDDIDGTHTVMVDFDANVDAARAAIAKALGSDA